MNKRQAVALGSLRAVQAFINERRQHLPTAYPSGARIRLDETIEQLDLHVSSQSGDRLVSMGLTAKQKTLRRALIRNHVAPIVRIAKAQGIKAPELSPVRMPRGDPALQRIVDYAMGMADAAEPYSAQFIALGIAPGFTARLRNAARELVATVNNRDSAFAGSVGATAGIDDRLKFARKLVAVLDAFVVTDLQDNHSLLAAWELVKRTPRVPSRKRETSPALPVTNPGRLLPAPTEPFIAPLDVTLEERVT